MGTGGEHLQMCAARGCSGCSCWCSYVVVLCFAGRSYWRQLFLLCMEDREQHEQLWRWHWRVVAAAPLPGGTICGGRCSACTAYDPSLCQPGHVRRAIRFRRSRVHNRELPSEAIPSTTARTRKEATWQGARHGVALDGDPLIRVLHLITGTYPPPPGTRGLIWVNTWDRSWS